MGTHSCQAEHIGYVMSGVLHVKHNDGSEGDAKPGDVYRIAPGQDAWVVGDDRRCSSNSRWRGPTPKLESYQPDVRMTAAQTAVCGQAPP